MSDHFSPKPARLEVLPLARGATVQVYPGTPLWMAGGRFGQVIELGRKRRSDMALLSLGRGKRQWVSTSYVIGA